MNKVYEIIRKEFDLRVENMVITYILSKGIECCQQITESDIVELEGNGLMTQSFVQGLARTAVKIATECTMTEILEFIVDRMDNRTITYDRMSEIATLLKDGLMEDDEYEAKEYMRETVDMSEEEAEYFGVDDLFDEEEEY